jgi:hypothetical protein
MPTGEHLRFHIGRFENGPAILPFCISFSIFSLAAKGFFFQIKVYTDLMYGSSVSHQYPPWS